MKKDYFILKMFRRLFWPSVISSVGFAFADVVDSFVLGRSLGEVGLAAIGLSLPLFMLINFFMDGLAIGGSVFFSQRMGEGDADTARAAFNRTWLVALGIGVFIAAAVNLRMTPCLALLGTVPSDGAVFFACRDYVRIIALGAPLLILNIVFANFLRNDNHATLASAGFLIGNMVDIVLNVVLVMGANMGTRGAALATVIGSMTAILIYLPGMFGRHAHTLKIRCCIGRMGETLTYFKTGFTTSVTHLLQLIFFIVINRLLMRMIGGGGVAVFDVVYSVSFFIVYIYNGAAEAMQPPVSTFYGGGNDEDGRTVFGLAVRGGLSLGAVSALVLSVFAERISILFGVSDVLLDLSVTAIRTYCIGFAFVGWNILYVKYEQARDRFYPALVIAVLRNCVLLIPFAYLFSHMGIDRVWFFYPVTEGCCAAVIWIGRLLAERVKPPKAPRPRWCAVIEANGGNMAEVLDHCIRFCDTVKASPQQKYAVTLVVEEISMSIIRNAMHAVKDGRIRVTLHTDADGGFVLNMMDNAATYNPFAVQNEAASDQDFDIDQVSMAMIRNVTKKMMYRKCSGFNSLLVQIEKGE